MNNLVVQQMVRSIPGCGLLRRKLETPRWEGAWRGGWSRWSWYACQAATATLLPLDLREPDKLESVAPSVFARFGRLDILVHAAAVLGRLTPVGHATAQDRTELLAVNTLAAWRPIQGGDPFLRRSDAGRAVFATDRRTREPLAYWGPYAASKAAADTLVLTWAAEVAAITAVRVNLFDPGPMRTRLRAAAFPGEDPASVPPPADAAAALCLPGETRHGKRVRYR